MSQTTKTVRALRRNRSKTDDRRSKRPGKRPTRDLLGGNGRHAQEQQTSHAPRDHARARYGARCRNGVRGLPNLRQRHRPDAKPSRRATSGDESAAQTPVPEEPLTVDVEERRIIVSTMSDPYYGDGERTEATWIYPVLVGSRQSDAIDAINAFIEGKIEQDAAWTEGLNADNFMDDPEVGTRASSCRATPASRSSLRSLRLRLRCHAHHLVGRARQRLQRRVPVRPGNRRTGVGRSSCRRERGGAAARADAAVRVFYNREGSDIYTVDEAVEHALEGTYYLADEGVILATDDYALGSYAYGRRNIVVIPFDDSVEAGQVVKVNATR